MTSNNHQLYLPARPFVCPQHPTILVVNVDARDRHERVFVLADERHPRDVVGGLHRDAHVVECRVERVPVRYAEPRKVEENPDPAYTYSLGGV